MNYHDLKILPEYFEQVRTGRKTFEVRVNDRDFQPGDMVCLREYQKFSPTQGAYTARSMHFTIGYVLSIDKFFMHDRVPGLVAFSLLPEKEVACLSCEKLKTRVDELAEKCDEYFHQRTCLQELLSDAEEYIAHHERNLAGHEDAELLVNIRRVLK